MKDLKSLSEYLQAGANIRDLKTSSYTFLHAQRDSVIIAFVLYVILKVMNSHESHETHENKNMSQLILSIRVFTSLRIYNTSFKELKIVFILYRVSEKFRNTPICFDWIYKYILNL